MISPDGHGRARIADFGLAGLAESFRPEEARTGTPAYMSPEQLAGREVTAKSDIYSLGLLLFELFTGKRAFDATTAAELQRLQLESTPTSPSSLVDGLDPAVERVILRCLEKEPADRPASVLSVAAALAAGKPRRRRWSADAGGAGGMHPGAALACHAIIVLGLATAVWVGTRFPDHFPEYNGLPGFLNVASLFFCHMVLTQLPLGDSSAWYGPTAITMLLVILALAVFGFSTSLAGRPLFRPELIPQE